MSEPLSQTVISRTGRIAWNASTLMISRIFTMLGTPIYLAFVVRHLGSEKYGVYSSAFAFVYLFAVIGDFGLDTLLVREVARDRARTPLWLANVLSFRLVTSLVAAFCIGVASGITRYPVETRYLMGLITLGMILGYQTNPLYSILIAHEEMHRTAKLSIVVEMVRWVIVGGTVFFAARVLPFVIALLGVDLFRFLQASYVVRRRLGLSRLLRLDTSLWRMIIPQAFPLALAGAFMVIYLRVDVVILSRLCGFRVVGWYAAAQRLIELPALFSGALINATFPLLSRLCRDEPDEVAPFFHTILRCLMGVGGFITTLFVLFSPTLVAIMYGSDFRPTAGALRILAVLPGLMYVGVLLQYSLLALDRQNENAKIFGVGALVNVGANLALIPHYGLSGASVARVAGEATIVLLSFLFLQRYLDVRRSLGWAGGKVAGAMAAMAGVGILSIGLHLPWWVGVMLSSGMYFCCLWVTRFITKRDVRAVQGLARRGLARISGNAWPRETLE